MNSIALFFIFLFSFIAISLLGFLTVRTILDEVWEQHLSDESLSISGSILAVLSIFVSVPLTVVIIFLWTDYNDTVESLKLQSNKLLTMYNTVKLLNNKLLLNTMKQYIYGKIDYSQLQSIILINNDNSLIYQQIILMLNNIVPEQFVTQEHVNVEMWLVIIIGVISVMIGTWFVKSPFYIHLYLIISVSAVMGTLVFLAYYYNTLDCHQCIENDLKQQLITML
jgi:hypothetical protein